MLLKTRYTLPLVVANRLEIDPARFKSRQQPQRLMVDRERINRRQRLAVFTALGCAFSVNSNDTIPKKGVGEKNQPTYTEDLHSPNNSSKPRP